MNISGLISWIGIVLCAAALFVLCAAPALYQKLCGLLGFYLGCAVLFTTARSVQTALAFFVCGVGSAVLLSTGHVSLREREPMPKIRKDVLLFRAAVFAICGVIGYTAAVRMRSWISVGGVTLFVSLWAGLAGFIGLALEADLLSRCVFLQCVCAAFTFCYLHMDNGTVTFAGLTAINLLLALSGAILNVPAAKASDEEDGQ